LRRTILLSTLVAAITLACTGVVVAQQTTTPEPTTPPASSSDAPKTPNKKIPGSYIVVLKDNEEPEPVVAKKKQEIGDLKVKHVYKKALKGFAVEIPDEEASKLRDNPEVAYVEQDQEVQAVAQTLPWGIDKVDADRRTTKAGDGTGTISNVNAYIIDTGIDTDHPDLNVVNHVNPSGAGGGNQDCNGHGTHVAGTVAARDNTTDVVGVGPGAPLTGVKVLNCDGRGSTSGVIAGVEWVTDNAKKPAIANMSLGGGASVTLDQAVTESAKSGIFYALAAGNDNRNACKQSLARAGKGNNGILTVGATNKKDKRASFSNHGSCVDIWAPGVNILSTKRGGGTTTKSGTSMASPHGAGGAALYLSTHAGENPTSVETALKSAGQEVGLPNKRLLVRTF
jgi:aqualysin 1